MQSDSLPRSSSLANWIIRIHRQCAELLDPTLNPHAELDATERLTSSCHDNPSWTLLALANLAKEAQEGPIRLLALTLIRRFIARQSPDDERGQIWDTVPVATIQEIQSSLIDCIYAIPGRSDATAAERNNLCKTVAFVHEMDRERGQSWAALEKCLSQLAVTEQDETFLPGTSNAQHEQARLAKERKDLYYTFLYESPAIVADAPVRKVIENLVDGLRRIDPSLGWDVSVAPLEAAVAILQVDDCAADLAAIVPEILHALQRLASTSDERVQDSLLNALTAFGELYNMEQECAALLAPYLSDFVPFVQSLVAAPSFPVDVLNMAIEILASTAEILPAQLRQEPLLGHMQTAVKTLLGIMESIPGDALDTDFWNADVADEEGEQAQKHMAAENALERIVVAIGSQYMLSAAFELIPAMQQSQDWQRRYAAMSAIGTLAEGSSAEFRKDIDAIMQLVVPVLTDSNPRLVYAAVYCVAELCTYLEGIVQEKHGDLVLSAFLRILSIPSAPPRLVAYTCAALVNFVEDLSDPLPASLVAHSNALFNQLHGLVANRGARKDVVLKAMGAIAQLASALALPQALTHESCNAVLDVLWLYLDSDVDNDLKACAMDCISLLTVSAGRDLVSAYLPRLITSLLHIQHTHQADDDPCKEQVLKSLVRVAETLGVDFIPHVDAVVPVLLRQANCRAEQQYHPYTDTDEVEGDDDAFLYTTSSSGSAIRVNTELVREKAAALELLSSLAHALATSLTQVGSSDGTAGDWTSYAETMLSLASGLLAYEYSEDVRIAAAGIVPPLVRAFRATNVTQPASAYRPRHVENTIPSLLAALAYESEPDALAALFAAASEVVLAAPDAFTVEDAATFVNVVREQIEGFRHAAEAQKDGASPELRKAAAEQCRTAFECMSQALQAFVRTTGSRFPIQGLSHILGLAIYGRLGLEGEIEWALKLVADLVEYSSPNAVAWTAGFLPVVRECLSSDNAAIRRICAYTAGIAALNGGGQYSSFYQTCFGSLSGLLAQKPQSDDHDELAAYDNVLSAVAKIISNDTTGQVNGASVLPQWLSGLPIQADFSEMEPCYSLLLDLIAREHPIVSAQDPQKCAVVLQAFQNALSNPNTPKELYEPIYVGLQTYLSTAPPAARQAFEHVGRNPSQS